MILYRVCVVTTQGEKLYTLYPMGDQLWKCSGQQVLLRDLTDDDCMEFPGRGRFRLDYMGSVYRGDGPALYAMRGDGPAQVIIWETPCIRKSQYVKKKDRKA